MTAQEIPYDFRLMLEWGQRQLAALLDALPRALDEFARSITRLTGDAVSPVIPVPSQTQQEILVTVCVVTGLALAAFLVIQAVLLLAPRRHGAIVRLRQRNR